MKLSPKENFLRMMQRREPQRLPLDLPMTPPVRERLAFKLQADDVFDALQSDVRSIGALRQVDVEPWRQAYAQLGYVLPPDAEIDMFGITHVPPPPESIGQATHFRTMLHPLEAVTDVAQLEKLPWPQLLPPDVLERLARQTAAVHERGYVVLGQNECTIFEHAWYLRGMDNLFMDLAEGTGIADWLMDYFTERSARFAEAYVRAGADVIGLGDDVGTQRGMMMSVEMWREHLRPRLKRVIDAIRAAQGDRHVYVRYHSDGDIRPIIDELIGIGVDILNPVQPESMPVDEVISSHRDHLAFWGMIGTQTVMPFGTTEDVRSAVADCARLAANGAPIVVAPTHVLEPDVPDENIFALVDAVQQSCLTPMNS